MSNPNFIPASERGGTVVPNRIFVGGISASTTEAKLCALFQQYGRIKATKILLDRNGIARGYGFVTFESEEEAQKVLNEVKELWLEDRKLNIAPAVKKMNFPSVIGDSSSPVSPIYSGRDGLYQAGYPVVLHQPLYLPPYQYAAAAATAPTSGYPHYIYAAVEPSDLYHYAQTTSSQSHSSEYSESISDAASEGGRSYSKNSSVQASSPGCDYDSRSPRGKTSSPNVSTPYRYGTCGSNINTPPMPSQPFHIHQLLSHKAGMAIMAYPSSVVVGTPTIFQVKDTTADDDSMTNLGFHSPVQSHMVSGTLTPPPTPLSSIPCDFGSSSSIEACRKN